MKNQPTKRKSNNRGIYLCLTIAGIILIMYNSKCHSLESIGTGLIASAITGFIIECNTLRIRIAENKYKLNCILSTLKEPSKDLYELFINQAFDEGFNIQDESVTILHCIDYIFRKGDIKYNERFLKEMVVYFKDIYSESEKINKETILLSIQMDIPDNCSEAMKKINVLSDKIIKNIQEYNDNNKKLRIKTDLKSITKCFDVLFPEDNWRCKVHDYY